MEPHDPATPELGSLAQAARKKRLKSARGIMFFVGIVTILVNLAAGAMARSQVHAAFEAEIRELQKQNMVIDQNALPALEDEAVQKTQLVAGAFVAMGVIFIVLGTQVYRYPVGATVSGLVLYLLGAAISGILDPGTLAKGLVVKILFVAALVKAVQAAAEYRKSESAPQPDGEPAPDAAT